MKILVTGGAGYIGSVLVRRLIESGNEVRILDKFLFGLESVKEIMNNPRADIMIGDVNDSQTLEKAVSGMDAVVHLAAIVGDTACMAAETSTVIKTNFVSGAELAKLCKSNGIGKFIFASTCSVYGINNKILDENSETNPISLYAQTKLGAENEILKETNRMATILRFATVYGLSPRMRFDLVINYLTLKAMKEKECFILGGNQWRCFVHTVDIAEAIKLVLEAKNERVAGQVFNVSSDNYQIKDIGKLIEKCIPDCNVEYKTDVEDKRTYMVSAEKIKGLGFEPKVTVEKGILEMKSALEKGQFKNPNDSKYYNYK